jgi:hypothetical protein
MGQTATSFDVRGHSLGLQYLTQWANKRHLALCFECDAQKKKPQLGALGLGFLIFGTKPHPVTTINERSE